MLTAIYIGVEILFGGDQNYRSACCWRFHEHFGQLRLCVEDSMAKSFTEKACSEDFGNMD